MRTAILERMDVQEVLGVPQEKEMEVPDSRADLAEREVLQILCEIGPDAIPFKPESVEEYKKKMISSDAPFLYRQGVKSEVLCTIFAFAVVASFILTVIYTGAQIYGHHWLYALLCVAVGLPATFGFLMVFGLAHESYSYRPAEWKSERLSKCNDMVPEFALETALSVKERLPEAEFFVESFVKGRKEGCPFLGITCKGRNYYLEVWNEPGFKAKRLA